MGESKTGCEAAACGWGMGVLEHGLNTPDPLGQGGQCEACSFKILAYTLKKPATNKRFNGLGFYSSSHLPRFEGVWWPGEGGEVRLNGKAARFHFWLQVPLLLMPGATKQGFVFVFHGNLRPWGGGYKQCQRHGPSFRW